MEYYAAPKKTWVDLLHLMVIKTTHPMPPWYHTLMSLVL